MEKGRWEKAQGYEKQWWDRRKAGMNLEFYEDYAKDLQQQLFGVLEIHKDTYILEIGSGAAGILTFLKSDHRYAIDPLENFYAEVPEFAAYRDPAVKYFTAKGEKLQFDHEFFDLIIMDNVLDHCEDPLQVLKEMIRVLKPNGIIFFRQNVYHWWGKFIRQLMEMAEIDKGHPHTFTFSSLQNLVTSNHLSILHTRRSGYFQRWKRELFARTKNDLIKALLLVNRDKVLFLLKKTS